MCFWSSIIELHLCEYYQAKPLEAISEDGLANTDVDRDKNVLIGLMTSPIYVIMHVRRQQVRTELRLLFICFAVFSPIMCLKVHDKSKTT